MKRGAASAGGTWLVTASAGELCVMTSPERRASGPFPLALVSLPRVEAW
ncbi:hypothetical protein A7982_13673 [Minicystis rosea]|nr:hypothetical protein A7982_13673 [Minicystis rosea]